MRRTAEVLVTLKIILSITLLMIPPIGWAAEEDFNCEDLLKSAVADSDVARMKDQFLTIDRGLELAVDRSHLSPITTEDLKALKVPSKLMTILKKMPQHYVSPDLLTWWALEHHIFSAPTDATPEVVSEFGLPTFRRFEAIFASGPDFSAQYKEAHRGQIQAKKHLIADLKRLNLIVSTFFGQPIDLMTESGWVKLLDIQDLAQLGNQIEFLRKKDRELSLQISKFLVDLSSYQGLSRFYHNYFFEDGRRRMASDAEPLVEKLLFSDIKNLISELGFAADKQHALFEQVDILVESSREQPLNTRALAILIFYKAYLERFESIPMLTDKPVGERFITARQFLQAKQLTHQYHLMSAFLDAQFEEYVQESEQLNQRIKSLKQRFADLQSSFSLPLNQSESLATALSEIEEVHELDQNLSDQQKTVRALELQLDELIESVISQMEKERLKSLSDLNFRGHRLIADKAYSLNGIDYESVVFTADVVKFLISQPTEGARFLGALTKGYVAVKKTSGLRRLPNIHDDFRDIKVINSNYGKVRLVGKRVGSTIYFFYVYQSEKPYDSKLMRTKVENFNP